MRAIIKNRLNKTAREESILKIKIYVDILLSINLILNYLLLFLSMRISQAPLRRGRLLLAAAIGALYSLIIFIPHLPAVILGLSKPAMCLLMVFIAAPYRGTRPLVKECCLFFGVNFLFAGAMLAVWIFLKPNRMFFYNGIIYFHISAPVLVAATVLAYLCSELVFFLFRNRPDTRILDVRLGYHGRCAHLRGFVDTGNTLSDPFSGTPVAIVSRKAVRELLSDEEWAFLSQPITIEPPAGFRLIPCHTASGGTMMPVFTPDYLLIEEKEGFAPAGRTLIGISTLEMFRDSCTILLHPKLEKSSHLKMKKTAVSTL